MSQSGTSGDMMWQVLVLVSIWTLTGVNARTLSEDQAETLHNLHKRKYMYIYKILHVIKKHVRLQHVKQ